jgi:transmembrane sensor
MSDRVARAREAASRLEPGWGPDRVEAALRRFPARRRRRPALVAGVLAIAATAAIIAAATRASAPPDSPPPTRGLLRLSDGSTAIALTAGTEVVPVEIGPQRVVVELVRGAARFAVTPSRERTFRVRSGIVDVVVLGTEFTVERDTRGVTVGVHRGRVRVDLGDTTVELGAGSRRLFEATTPAPPRDAHRSPAATPPTGPPAPAGEAAAPRRKGARWRVLADRGEFDDAYRTFEPADLRDDVADLLLAADVARLSGHSREAVTPLRRIMARHAADARVPIAAFTLGRVLLDELGDPRGAADAFSAARAAAPDGPLAEDALAREVEAWSRAGEEDRAAGAAQLYVERHPHGRRLKAVRRFGGLD